jgi:hypothetical protein
LNIRGSAYDFIVQKVKGDYTSGMNFNWRLGNNMRGNITLTNAALDTAHYTTE